MKTLITIFYIIIGLAPVWGAQASKGTNAASSAQPPVELRGYKVDSLVFFPNLKRVESAKAPKADITQLTKLYLEEMGIDLRTPSALCANDRLGLIAVRTTAENHKKIGPFLDKLNHRD